MTQESGHKVTKDFQKKPHGFSLNDRMQLFGHFFTAFATVSVAAKNFLKRTKRCKPEPSRV